jgi:hypothetical protein
MAHFVFTCPATLMNVQHLLVDDQGAADNEYEGITCLACAMLHFVNRKTGKLLGQEHNKTAWIRAIAGNASVASWPRAFAVGHKEPFDRVAALTSEFHLRSEAVLKNSLTRVCVWRSHKPLHQHSRYRQRTSAPWGRFRDPARLPKNQVSCHSSLVGLFKPAFRRCRRPKGSPRSNLAHPLTCRLG